MTYLRYLQYEVIMSVLHLYAIFVLYRWVMFIPFVCFRVPRLAFICVIWFWVIKKDPVTQAKWQKWEGWMRLITVLLLPLASGGIQTYIMLGDFCN